MILLRGHLRVDVECCSHGRVFMVKQVSFKHCICTYTGGALTPSFGMKSNILASEAFIRATELLSVWRLQINSGIWSPLQEEIISITMPWYLLYKIISRHSKDIAASNNRCFLIAFHALHMEVKDLEKEVKEKQWTGGCPLLDDCKSDICSLTPFSFCTLQRNY